MGRAVYFSEVSEKTSGRFGGILLLPAQVQNQLHDEVLDLVAHFAVVLVLHGDRIGDRPFHRRYFQPDRHTAHVHQKINVADVDGRQALGVVGAQIEVLLLHGAEGIGGQPARRGQAGARGQQNVGAVSAGEGFRHLAAAGVPDTNEQDPLGRHYNFSRKSEWTRKSAVSSGWNVA